MDLVKIKEGNAVPFDVPLLFKADGEPECGFKVVGINTPQYQESDRAWKTRGIQKSARRGRGIDGSTKTGAEEVIELIAKREQAICEACIVEMYGFTNDGEPAELNAKTLEDIFKARPTWRSKVVAAIETENVFTEASSVG